MAEVESGLLVYQLNNKDESPKLTRKRISLSVPRCQYRNSPS